MMFMTEKKVEKKLAWLNEEYSLRKYRKGTLFDREYDFYNYFKDRSEAFFKIFGKEQRKNEHPKVAEEREFLILGMYENRQNKAVKDLALEKKLADFKEKCRRENEGDESVEILEKTLANLKSLL